MRPNSITSAGARSATAKDLLPESDSLETATDQAIAACGRDARQAVRALRVTNEFLGAQIESYEPPFRMVVRAGTLSFRRVIVDPFHNSIPGV
jgi:hypothetical protein